MRSILSISFVLRDRFRTDVRRLDIIHENRPDRSPLREIIDVARRRLCSRYYTQIALDKSSKREPRVGRVEAALASIVAIPQLCPNSSGRHLRGYAAPPDDMRDTRAGGRISAALPCTSSFHSLPFFSNVSPFSCERELLLSNDTGAAHRRQRIPDLFIRPSDYNVSVIPRDNLSRQGGEAVSREFIDGCSCVPYGATAVRREVSAGHVLNRLLVTIKARVRSKTLGATAATFSLSKIYKNYYTFKLLHILLHNFL